MYTDKPNQYGRSQKRLIISFTTTYLKVCYALHIVGDQSVLTISVLDAGEMGRHEDLSSFDKEQGLWGGPGQQWSVHTNSDLRSK